MPSFVPLFAASASLEREVPLTLADPARGVPVGEPAVLRPGVARYAGRTLLFGRLALGNTPLASPARAAVRRVAIAPSAELPGGELLELSPLPFGMEPVLRRLRGLPTFYLSPFDTAIEDDTLVAAGQALAGSVSTALAAAVFPDGLQLAPWAGLELIGGALTAAGDPGAGDWIARTAALYGSAPRCRVLDHAGRPLVDDPDPAVRKSFTVRLRDAADDALLAERAVTLGADSDLETALAAAPGSPASVVAPAGRYVEVEWAGAPRPGDAAAVVASVYETRDAAAPADETASSPALRLPAIPRMTLQVLDLSRWYPPVAQDTAIARYRAGSRVEPLVDGIATFQRLAADLRQAAGPEHGVYLAGWTFNRFPLDPAASDEDIVDVAERIAGAGGVVRVMCTKMVNLRDPDLPNTRALAIVVVTLLSDAALVKNVLANAHGKESVDGRGMFAFVVTPGIVFLIASLMANHGDFQWLLDAMLETATDTIDAFNAAVPGSAVFSSNPHRLADNPLADNLTQPLWGMEGDADQFNVWHNKSQMVRRPPGGGENGWVGYLGGIDINRNRVDAPGHGVGGPYHDVHARVTGPVVRDVFVSFEERWRVDHGLPED
ncbi:MAG TPA: hypothetical protein VFZ26_04740, partial [Gemmatimonadales bacterium]